MGANQPKRRGRGLLICLAGTDGSGKTTLSRLLVESLQRRGYDARYVHGVLPFNLFLRPIRKIARTVFMRGTDVDADYERYHTTMVSASQKHRFLSILYAIVWFASYCAEAFRPVTLPVRSGKAVVADRYIYDIILRIAIGIDRPVGSLAPLAGLFFVINARPDYVFFIDTPEEVANQRKGYVHSFEYLHARRVRYQQMAERYGFQVLDGQAAPNELLDQILAHCFDDGAKSADEAKSAELQPSEQAG